MRNWLLGLAAVAAVSAAAAADDKKAQDAAAVAVVKKAIDAHGGADALNKYKAGTMKMKGTASVMGVDAEFTGSVSYSLPDKFKLQLDTTLMGQEIKIVQVANGKDTKNTINGMAFPLQERQKEELASNAIEQEVSTLTPLLDAEKFTLKAGDEADVDGKKAAVVIVSGKRLNNKEWKLFFDKDKNLQVKVQRKGTGADGTTEVDEESFMEDYKKVDGILTPHKYTVKHDGTKFLTFEVTEMKYKEKIDDKEFATDD